MTSLARLLLLIAALAYGAMPVTGMNVPRGMNSTEVPTASPQAKPTSDPVQRSKYVGICRPSLSGCAPGTGMQPLVQPGLPQQSVLGHPPHLVRIQHLAA